MTESGSSSACALDRLLLTPSETHLNSSPHTLDHEFRVPHVPLKHNDNTISLSEREINFNFRCVHCWQCPYCARCPLKSKDFSSARNHTCVQIDNNI